MKFWHVVRTIALLVMLAMIGLLTLGIVAKLGLIPKTAYEVACIFVAGGVFGISAWWLMTLWTTRGQ